MKKSVSLPSLRSPLKLKIDSPKLRVVRPEVLVDINAGAGQPLPPVPNDFT